MSSKTPKPSAQATRELLRAEVERLDRTHRRLYPQQYGPERGLTAKDLPASIQHLDKKLAERNVPPEMALNAWTTTMAATTVNTNLAIVQVASRPQRRLQRVLWVKTDTKKKSKK